MSTGVVVSSVALVLAKVGIGSIPADGIVALGLGADDDVECSSKAVVTHHVDS